APRFVIVANTTTRDGGAAVVAGNERVLRARLADARFFWDQDRRVKLEDRVPALRNIIFHARLGSMEDKVFRMKSLIDDLLRSLPNLDVNSARSAALLAKADLTTGMVGEFPELQGVMGRYYALAEGETAEVAEAIAQHYSPLGPNDSCPSEPTAVAVALADKIDTLVGFFAIDEKPTGSRDPYALRRAVLGVIRLVVENRTRMPLSEIIQNSWQLYKNQGKQLSDLEKTNADLLSFFADRLKVALREKGVRHDLIDAVFSLGGEDDLVRLLERVEALGALLDSDDGANLLVAYRRAANIVRIESKKDKRSYDDAVDRKLLRETDEKTLASALAGATERVDPLLADEDFSGAMAALAGLRSPIDDFFDHVTVNVDDPALRANRLALLSEITATMNRIADFSRIEG
ncbi:MAG: glycine--tRNA ligase subunit beta, partial [Alphaproteobacteria bacterium]